MAQVQINLLTREFRGVGDSAAARAAKWVVFAAVASMLTLGSLQYFQYRSVSHDVAAHQTELERSKKKVEEIKRITVLDDGVKKGQAMIQGARTAQASTGAIFTAIQAKTPSGISISSLAIKGVNVDLTVEASSLVEVEKFIDSLRQDKTISAVELQSLNQDSGKPVSAQLTLNFAKGGQSK